MPQNSLAPPLEQSASNLTRTSSKQRLNRWGASSLREKSPSPTSTSHIDYVEGLFASNGLSTPQAAASASGSSRQSSATMVGLGDSLIGVNSGLPHMMSRETSQDSSAKPVGRMHFPTSGGVKQRVAIHHPSQGRSTSSTTTVNEPKFGPRTTSSNLSESNNAPIRGLQQYRSTSLQPMSSTHTQQYHTTSNPFSSSSSVNSASNMGPSSTGRPVNDFSSSTAYSRPLVNSKPVVTRIVTAPITSRTGFVGPSFLSNTNQFYSSSLGQTSGQRSIYQDPTRGSRTMPSGDTPRDTPLEIDFSMFASDPDDLASTLGSSLLSPVRENKPSPISPSPGNTPSSEVNDDDDDDNLHNPSRRDTVTSLADLLVRSTSRASKRSTLKSNSPIHASLATVGDSKLYSTNDTPHVNDSHVTMTRKPVPCLLDLDISGSGPSLASPVTTEQDFDDIMERHLDIGRAGRSDGSSSDTHSAPSFHSRTASYSSTADKDLPPTPTTPDPPDASRIGTFNGSSSLQRSLSKSLAQNSCGNNTTASTSPYIVQHSSSSNLSASTVSSSTSLSTSSWTTSASKSSARSRIGRLFSKVAGVPLKTKGQDSFDETGIKHEMVSPKAPSLTSRLRRKPSLSNLLNGIKGDGHSIEATSPSTDDSTHERTTPRKSFDMLRPNFFRPKSDDAKALPQRGESRPQLKGRRSYDMLKRTIAATRISIDDGSSGDYAVNAGVTNNEVARTTDSRPAENKTLPTPSPLTRIEVGVTASPLPLSSVNGNDASSKKGISPVSERNSIPVPDKQSGKSRDSATVKSNGVHVRSQPKLIDKHTLTGWDDMENGLKNISSTNNSVRMDKTTLITTTLIPFLKAQEPFANSFYLDQSLAEYHRGVLLSWLEQLMAELDEAQPGSRGACLEGVAGILESHFLSISKIGDNVAASTTYRSRLVSVLNFAIDKLNDKAVYANTLAFSGRMLALAFFRIEGIGSRLLRSLPPVRRMSMRRVLGELGLPPNFTCSTLPIGFPPYLNDLCFSNLASHCQKLTPLSTDDGAVLVEDAKLGIQVGLTGNWLIRWTASDSDLPFAFYRAYHRQLVGYLSDIQVANTQANTLINLPGFLFIAASFLDKCDALVHRSLRSVTTLGPNNSNFNAGESMNMAVGAKPKVLDLAHRRLVTTALEIVGGSPRSIQDPDQGAGDSQKRRFYFGNMLNIWIRAIAKRTNLWDTRSVFLLLDFLDGLFYTVLYTAPFSATQDGESSPKLVESSVELFDLEFLRTIVKRILTKADNTVCLMRTIAFVYSQFETLTYRASDRNALCLNLLLEPAVFEHLFLHWNSGVRGYFLRLLVWRLSRLGINDGKQAFQDGDSVVRILLEFNTRLDVIRRRHDELSPQTDAINDIEASRLKRSTICSTRGVTDAPWAIEESPPDDVSEVMSDREVSPTSEQDKLQSGGKVSSWLRVVKRLGGARTRSRHDLPVHTIEPFRSSGDTRSEGKGGFGDHGCDSEANGQEITDSIEEHSSESRPESPTFFKFEFELGADIPRSDSFDAPNSTPASSVEGDHVTPGQGSSPSVGKLPDGGPPAPSPRVSKRFSKRASLLPPAALTMLRESSQPVPAVPALPSQYAKAKLPEKYDTKLHPYAVRALAEYEQSLEEEHEWKARIAEDEEPETKPAGDLVPRLGVSWPVSFNESED